MNPHQWSGTALDQFSRHKGEFEYFKICLDEMEFRSKKYYFKMF